MGNHPDVWIELKSLAQLMGIAIRTVQWRLQTGQYIARWAPSPGGRDGKKLLVALSSLPDLIQERYWRQRCPKLFEGKDTTWMLRVGDKKRGIAGLRMNLVQLLNDELAERNGRKKAEIIEKFIRKYNGAEIDERILAKLGPISMRTLHRWRRDYRDFDMEGLVPGHTSRTFDELPVDEKAFLDNLWLDQNQRSVSTIFREYKKAGYSTLTYARVRSYLKRIPAAVACLHREGKKVYEDRYGQYIERDYSKLRANEIWVGDHHQLDLAIRGFNGKAMFPWITVWQDVRSRKVMDFCIHHTPCTETIVASFRSGVLNHGVPEHVLIDNGKDFTSRRFSGGRKRFKLRIDTQEMTNLLHGLQVKAHFCNPYNARSKPVERTFRTLEEDFGKQWETYRGGNVEHRKQLREPPARLESVLADPNRLPTLPEVDAALQEWIAEYNSRPHRGQAMEGKTPDQVWQETLGEKREADPERLRLAMMAVEDRKIGRNGIRIFGQVYWNEAMWAHKGERVRVRYDLHDLGRIEVYDSLEGGFLFTAECRPMAQWLVSQDDIKRAQKEGREERKQVEVFANVIHRGRRGLRPAARAIQTKRDAVISRQQTVDSRQGENPGMEDEDDELHALVSQRKELSGNTAESRSDDGIRKRPIFKSYWEKEEWERRQRARADADGEETGEIH